MKEVETCKCKNPHALLEVEGLHIEFHSSSGHYKAVDNISFSVSTGETVAIVGESGSGKTCTALALARLLPPPPSCQIHGSISFNGTPVFSCNNRSLQKIRGGGIAYIFQEPSMALNPAWKIGFQVAESVRYHQPEVKDIKQQTLKHFEEVGIGDPERFYNAYPHELSGGMQQRAVIAMAVACRPQLLVADEPTTALDVSLQKQICSLLKSLQKKHNLSLLLITHNFSLLPDLCQRVLVMFRGKIVESGDPERLLNNPQHPYTRALINCIPRLGQHRTSLPSIDYSTLS